MKENIREILLQYKNRIDEIENKENEFEDVKDQLNELVKEREQKKEELKELEPREPGDFFYDETQEEITSIQKDIDEKNENNKQLKADVEQEKKTIQSEILKEIRNIKTELNNLLRKDKEDQEKMLAEISEYEARQQSFEEQKRRQFELHGTEIKLSQAALERMEEQKQEIEGKRKLVQEIDDRRKLARDDVKEYNNIIKVISNNPFDSIKDYIIEASKEVEKEVEKEEQEIETLEYPEYPNMDEEWKKHVEGQSYAQDEIDKQVEKAFEQRNFQKKLDDVYIKQKTWEEIQQAGDEINNIVYENVENVDKDENDKDIVTETKVKVQPVSNKVEKVIDKKDNTKTEIPNPNKNVIKQKKENSNQVDQTIKDKATNIIEVLVNAKGEYTFKFLDGRDDITIQAFKEIEEQFSRKDLLKKVADIIDTKGRNLKKSDSALMLAILKLESQGILEDIDLDNYIDCTDKWEDRDNPGFDIKYDMKGLEAQSESIQQYYKKQLKYSKNYAVIENAPEKGIKAWITRRINSVRNTLSIGQSKDREALEAGTEERVVMLKKEMNEAKLQGDNYRVAKLNQKISELSDLLKKETDLRADALGKGIDKTEVEIRDEAKILGEEKREGFMFENRFDKAKINDFINVYKSERGEEEFDTSYMLEQAKSILNSSEYKELENRIRSNDQIEEYVEDERYSEEFINELEEWSEEIFDSKAEGDVNQDELYNAAVQLARNGNGEELKASTIARELRIGYPRAMKILDEIQKQGVISQDEVTVQNKANTSSKTEDAQKFDKKLKAQVDHDKANKATQEKNKQATPTVEKQMTK